jgi:hypothetical protein
MTLWITMRYLIKHCEAWFSRNIVLHRLVVMCSVSSRGNTNIQDDIDQRVKTHYVNSWTLEEYFEAIQNKLLFDSIRDVLDGSLDSKDTARELVNSKFYFSGGSSLYMFALKTEQVVELVDDSVREIQDPLPYIKGTIGDQSNFAVNRLFNIYIEYSIWRQSIVSEYAAIQLAMKMGRLSVENFSKVVRTDLSPMYGWLLEMWFFASLRNEGVVVYDDHQNEKETWGHSDIFNFDPNDISLNLFDCLCQVDTPTWLKPLKWIQGGYDAVCMDLRKGLVRFVQISRGTARSFKMQYFASFLQNLQQFKRISFEIKKLEIYFLVPKKNVEGFIINDSDISGKGTLSGFGKGWECGNEFNQVRIRGIQGFDQ